MLVTVICHELYFLRCPFCIYLWYYGDFGAEFMEA